jgi:hypothetical protein
MINYNIPVYIEASKMVRIDYSSEQMRNVQRTDDTINLIANLAGGMNQREINYCE